MVYLHTTKISKMKTVEKNNFNLLSILSNYPFTNDILCEIVFHIRGNQSSMDRLLLDH